MKKIRLQQTCIACPEQYDAFISDEKIGYLRLRHGYFYCQFTPTDEIVYGSNTKGDGSFDSDESEYHLNKAKKALLLKYLEFKDNELNG